MRPGEVAVEQVLLSIEGGLLSPRETMAGFGWRWVGTMRPTWNDVEALLAEIWRRLPGCDAPHRAAWIRVPIEALFPVVAIDRPAALRRVA